MLYDMQCAVCCTRCNAEWMVKLICFLLKKEDVLHIQGYLPVCLLDTVYKVLSAIITDRLY